jgi:hypothetical protein
MKLYFLLLLLAMALAPCTGDASVQYGLRYRKLHSQKAVGTGRKLTGCGMSGGKAGRYLIDECEDDYYVEEVVPDCAPVSAPVKAPTGSIEEPPVAKPVSALVPVSPPLKAPVASPVSPPEDDDTISNDPMNVVDRQGDDDGPGIPGLGLDDDEPDAQHVPSNDDPKAL